MAKELAISLANLRFIEDSLATISREISHLNGRVNQVDGNVKIVESKIEILAREFRDYVEKQALANRKAEAKMNLSAIRDKLKDNFGH